MLKFFISTSTYLLPYCMWIALFFNIVQWVECKRITKYDQIVGVLSKKDEKKRMWSRRYMTIFAVFSIILGLLCSTAIFIIQLLEPKKMLKLLTKLNRQIISVEFIGILLFIIIFFFLWYSIIKNKQRYLFVTSFITLFVGGIVTIALSMTIFPFIMQLTQEFIAFGEDSFSTESLLRLGGYVLALFVGFMLIMSVFQLFKRIIKGRGIFTIIFSLVLCFDFGLRGISSLAKLGILSTKNNFIFDLMILEDSGLIYKASLYVAMILLISIFVFFTHLRLKRSYEKPADKRKQLWWLRNCRRWSVVALCFILISYFSITVVHAYINRPVELAPAQDWVDGGKTILVPLSEVEDGHLHRFEYLVDGHNIRFIIVKKPNGSTAYGVGLDACEICGLAGYFERNNQVVCKRCDVVMNKATIGFKGGCNPIPFPYEVKDSQIVIQKADLEKEKDRFPIGE